MNENQKSSLSPKCITDEPYNLTFILPGLPKVTSNGPHGKWFAAAAERKRWVIKTGNMAIICGLPREPLKKARITLTRMSSFQPDYDNLVISFKPILDGLKRAGVIVDDRMDNIGRPEYLHEKTSPRKGQIRIHVEAIP